MQEKSRRILILTTAYLPQVGGSELAIKNITDRLPEFDFDLITSRFSPNVPAHEKIGNVNVYRVGNTLSRSSFLLPKNFLPLSIFAKARELMAQHGQYDLIHAYQASQAAGAGWLLGWLYPRIPFLVTVQEGKDLGNQSALMRFFRYLIFRKATRATAISAYLAAYVASQNHHLPVDVIPNGVGPEMFEADGASAREPLTVVTTSRLVEKNGVQDLIDATAIIKEKIPVIKLIIIGDGHLRGALEERSRTRGLEANITFAGEVANDHLSGYLSRATVFVRPSLSEGLGIAFLEAMAAGVPVVATPVGGIVDFLEDGKTGLFCRVGDPEDIAAKISTFLSDESLRHTIAAQAKEVIRERYTWPAIAGAFRNLYGDITQH